MQKPALLLGIMVIVCTFAVTSQCFAEERRFSEIVLDQPVGWDGDERAGFITGNRNEYLVTLGKKDTSEESYLAQVSIYIIPNTQGLSAEESAIALATQQDDSTAPVREGLFWKFSGYPRSNIIKGMTVTRVAATREWWCIIMAQGTNEHEADEIIASLSGLSERAKILLGK